MSSRASGRPADAGPFGSWSSVWTPPWFGDIAWRKEQDDERTAAMDRVAGGVPPDPDGVLECERGVVDAAFIERPHERRHREPEPVWSVTPSGSPSAGPVTFTVANDGTMTHEFVELRTVRPSETTPIRKLRGAQD